MTLFNFKMEGQVPSDNERLNKFAKGIHKASAQLERKKAEILSAPLAPFTLRDFNLARTSSGFIGGIRNMGALPNGIKWQFYNGWLKINTDLKYSLNAVAMVFTVLQTLSL